MKKKMAKIKTKMEEQKKEKVPVFNSWTHWYILVIGCLALLILLFYMFTKVFS